MREPKTVDEISAFHKLQKSDPRRALDVANKWIEDDPGSASALFSRHQVWMALGELEKALEDMNKSIEIDPRPMAYLARGEVYRHLGEYQAAVDDLARGEAIDPQRWQEHAVPLLFQADVYARLGDEANALAYCDRLPDHFWTPGMFGTPPGNKMEIAEELKRRAAAARSRKS